MTGNIAVSVRARLANAAREESRPFQEVLQYYGLERFLYRLACSPYCASFVLKGALMLRVWRSPQTRPTRDIDLLGFVENDVQRLEAIIRETCQLEVDDDGLFFDALTVAGERIKEDADYEGVRIRFVGSLEKARIPMQIDIAFGDVVHPNVQELEYPTILDQPSPRLRMYPRETVVAEKFEAMIFLGTVNSRMKDFYDIWLLAQQFDFDGAELGESITKTFHNRATKLDPDPIALTESFTGTEVVKRQWAAFVRRSSLTDAPATLDQVRAVLSAFLLPPAAAIIDGRPFTGRWPAGGPWQK